MRMKNNTFINTCGRDVTPGTEHCKNTSEQNKTLNDAFQKRELANCDFTKVVLMLMVVFYHSILFWNGSWFNQKPIYSAPILQIVAKWLNSFHVYGFALVSGYIFYFLKQEQNRYNTFSGFVKNKAKRLLVPYVFLSAVWVAPIACLYFQYNWKIMIQRFVLATSPNQLWFLWMLFDVFILFWLLADFFTKYNFWGFIVAGVFWIVGVGGSTAFPNVFMIWTAFQYVPLFWLGFKLRQHGAKMAMRIPSVIYILVHLLLFGLTQKLGTQDGVLEKCGIIALSFVTHIAGAMMAFVVLQKVANKVNWRGKIFQFLSKRTMIVYLFHQQVIYFLVDLLNGSVNPHIHALINFAGAMAISLVIASVLLRFKVTCFLVGEKWDAGIRSDIR